MLLLSSIFPACCQKPPGGRIRLRSNRHIILSHNTLSKTWTCERTRPRCPTSPSFSLARLFYIHAKILCIVVADFLERFIFYPKACLSVGQLCWGKKKKVSRRVSIKLQWKCESSVRGELLAIFTGCVSPWRDSLGFEFSFSENTKGAAKAK